MTLPSSACVTLLDARLETPKKRAPHDRRVVEELIMSAVIVRRYAVGFEGGARFSIRERQDGSFQAYRDNPYEGCNQSYQFDDEPISGLFGDVESAELALFHHPSFKAQIQTE